jgi:hypothetical protein
MRWGRRIMGMRISQLLLLCKLSSLFLGMVLMRSRPTVAVSEKEFANGKKTQ